MVKTITIDMEAYSVLAAHKRAGQSFSQAIKAHFGPRPTAGRFREMVQSVRTNADALITRNVKDFSRVPGLRVIGY